MSSLVELQVLKDDDVAHTREIGDEPVRIGRGNGNDLVLSDELISWNHAVVWVEGDRVWVSDLGSRNGTFVRGARIRTATEVSDGDVVQLGPDTRLRVHGAPEGVAATYRQLMLEDVDAGVRMPINQRFDIGAGPDCDLRLDEGDDRIATIIVHKNGEIWLGTDTIEHNLDAGRSFLVAGRQLRVIEVEPSHTPTAAPEGDRYPYTLEVTLEGATGPEAVLTDKSSSATAKVEADNRAILLYLLARQVAQDREEGVDPDDWGWCADEEVVRGIWGRTKSTQDANSLHVLVYRLRKELKDAGFDPWFIEKRRRYIRARVATATVS